MKYKSNYKKGELVKVRGELGRVHKIASDFNVQVKLQSGLVLVNEGEIREPSIAERLTNL